MKESVVGAFAVIDVTKGIQQPCVQCQPWLMLGIAASLMLCNTPPHFIQTCQLPTAPKGTKNEEKKDYLFVRIWVDHNCSSDKVWNKKRTIKRGDFRQLKRTGKC